MPRPFWKGTINFGLVNIPIQLFTAVKKHVIGFRLLHDKCGTPIENKRWCPKDEEEVSWDHIVKGLKLKDGSYLILDQENIKKLKPLKTDNIVITEFIDSDQLNFLYLDQHYYAGPQKLEDRAYGLFCKALQKAKLVAIGRFVMKDKEHVCAIEPFESILLLTTLNYSYEIQNPDQIIEDAKLPNIEHKELELASLLIDKLYRKEFDLSKYKDTFAQKILKALTTAKGKKALVKPEKAPKKKLETKPSLVSLLQESVGKNEKASK